MFQLKTLTQEAIPAALEKAQRYRMLDEPLEAESICLDVLAVDPKNGDALVTLILALTDQFQYRFTETFDPARALLDSLPDDYNRAYYRGIIFERCAKASLKQSAPGSGFAAYDLFREAMESYEKAEKLRPRSNDDAILRWNTCARYLNRHPEVQSEPVERSIEMLE